MSEQDSGFIYILSNESMPGLYKVGKTTGDPRERARQLHSTGVPTPFKVEYASYFPEGLSDAEAVVHENLSFQDGVKRVKNREFFEGPVSLMVRSVAQAYLSFTDLDIDLTMELERYSPDPSYFARFHDSARIMGRDRAYGRLYEYFHIWDILLQLTPLEWETLVSRDQAHFATSMSRIEMKSEVVK